MSNTEGLAGGRHPLLPLATGAYFEPRHKLYLYGLDYWSQKDAGPEGCVAITCHIQPPISISKPFGILTAKQDINIVNRACFFVQ